MYISWNKLHTMKYTWLCFALFCCDCIWGLWRQKQISQAGINNCIPQNTVGCNYLSMHGMPASGAKVLLVVVSMYWYCTRSNKEFVFVFVYNPLDPYEAFTHVYQRRFVHALSQWETTLRCNVVSNWLGASTESFLTFLRVVSLARGQS